jgi:adenylate cyclase
MVQARVALAPPPLSPRIVPVDLNDRAERALGTAVDSRRAFADLFQVLGDGKLVGGMDFLFSDPKDPAGDKAMIESASQMDGLVLAVVPVDPGITKFGGQQLTDAEKQVLRSRLWHPKVVNAGRIATADTFLMPFLALAQASRYLGHIGVRPDPDGLYRKTSLFIRWEDGYMPSLSLAMAAAQLKIDPSQVVVNAGHEVILPTRDGPLSIPIDDEGYVWIPYPAPWAQTWNRTPLDKVVAAVADPDAEERQMTLFDGGVVLTADLTTSHKDFGPVPMESIYPLSGIHTSVLNGILTRNLVSSPPAWALVVVVLVLGAAVAFFGTRKQTWVVHTGFGILVALVVALWVAAWFVFHTVPWLSAPAMALVAAWAAAALLRLLQSHEERLLMENALTRYFPKALASRVLQEKRTDLKPANKDLTLLFADIAGFTKWSSDKSSELVHGFLSDYLESMAHILHEQGGTVDKFMGDGILAFFGDPFDMPDHPQRCARAALAMQEKVKELQARWGEKAGIDLKIRIGINSGKVIVGNLGSVTRIEYTVIGSAVNLAQRMEGNAPVGGVLVTAETWSRIKDEFEFGEVKPVKAKGYDEPVDAYVLTGEK